MKKLPKELEARWNAFVNPPAQKPRMDTRTYTDADIDPNRTASESPGLYCNFGGRNIYTAFNRAERRMLKRFGCDLGLFD